MNELSDFLVKCGNDIKEGSATSELVSKALEFYTKCNVEASDEDNDQESIDDIMKYYTLGWYVYSTLENNKN
jgi:hypothetical protein